MCGSPKKRRYLHQKKKKNNANVMGSTPIWANIFVIIITQFKKNVMLTNVNWVLLQNNEMIYDQSSNDIES